MSESPSRRRVVRTRRIRFSYPSGSLPRHYVQGDLVMSHLVAVLSATFPEGEEFFVRSVRRYADRITDPLLQQQVKGFIGQEVTHGREHRALNDRLAEMGYPTRRVDRTVARNLARLEQRTPPLVRLAATAAFEHFTAVLAELILRDERAQELLGTSEVREMLLWHAVEESEHKAVAFDVYRAVGGSERLRIRVMRTVKVAFVVRISLYTLLSMAGDRASYNPVRLSRSLAALRDSPLLSRTLREALKDYNRVGFHPDDSDTEALLAAWTNELFGEQGRLAGHLQ